MKRLIPTILLCLCTVTANAREVRSKLIDSQSNEPISGAVIKISDGDGKTSMFTQSGHDGGFIINTSNATQRLTVRCLGYESINMAVDSVTSTIAMQPKATTLRNVTVKAPDILLKGDTLVYNVSQYAQAQDDAILDVIKRLPGIKVDDNGTIKYNGKPINKFYIDGNDFIGDQYNLATNNISHKDVKAVEVMENHQPIKALDGLEFSEQAGINIKLKEDAKMHWVGIARAGSGGSPALYTGSLFTLRMAPKVQNIFNIAADNTGWDPSTQIIDHDYDLMFATDIDEPIWHNYISDGIISSPLSPQRTRFNNSWIANAITAWRSNDTSLRLKINYFDERLKSSADNVTTYFNPAISDFTQINNMSTYSHNFNAQLRSETNKPSYYFKNKFTLFANIKKAVSLIDGTYNLTQVTRHKDFSVSNDTKFIKRSESNLFTLTSRNSVSYTPASLNLTSSAQRDNNLEARTTTELQFGRMWQRWNLYLYTGIDMDYNRLKADRSGIDYDNSSLSCGYNTFVAKVFASPKLEYNVKKWRINLQSPLQWLQYRTNGNYSHIATTPSVWSIYKIGAKSDITASASYRLTPPTPDRLLNFSILQDYRNLYVSSPINKSSSGYNIGTRYRYRNPMTSFFANISANYSFSKHPVTMNQIFYNDYIVTTFTSTPTNAKIVNLSGGISKGISHGRIVAGIDASFNRVSSSSMRNDILIPFKQKSVTANPYIRGSITRFLNFSYDLKYSLNRLDIKDDASSTTQSINHTLIATFTPTEQLTLSIGGDHYYSKSADNGGHANLCLVDATATYNIGKFQFKMEAKNILNNTHYNYTSYSTLSSTTYDYTIRPRNIIASVSMRF